MAGVKIAKGQTVLQEQPLFLTPLDWEIPEDMAKSIALTLTKLPKIKRRTFSFPHHSFRKDYLQPTPAARALPKEPANVRKTAPWRHLRDGLPGQPRLPRQYFLVLQPCDSDHYFVGNQGHRCWIGDPNRVHQQHPSTRRSPALPGRFLWLPM